MTISEAEAVRAPGTIQAAAADARPRSDVGTVILHWVAAIAMIASLLTGLRIAADAPFAPVAAWLSPVLPQGQIWTWHFAAGLTVLATIPAYTLYIICGRLARRNDYKRLRALTLPTAPRVKWAAVNIALHWLLYLLIAGLAVSGFFLYLGHSGWWVTFHRTTAWLTLVYIVAHVLGHYLYGGLWQLLRILRPQELQTRMGRGHPLLLASIAGSFVAAAFFLGDLGTRPLLIAPQVSDDPILDGVLDDPAWAEARPVRVLTQQGENLENRESMVEIRAVRFGEDIVFAFRWQDSSRSLMRMPLQKREDGWHVLQDGGGTADVMTYYEDKFSVLFTTGDEYGSGNTTFLGKKPLPDRPGALNSRGLHYTTDGSYHDLWQWKASRGGLLGHVDDMHIGPPLEPTPEQRAGKERYSAGYTSDPGTASYVYNYRTKQPNDFSGPVEVLRLPSKLAATLARMKDVPASPGESVPEGAVWWMTQADSLPYSPEQDSAIPVGTIIPSVLHLMPYEGDRADIAGAARWDNGWWTLEARRKLDSGSKYDAAFLPGTQLYLWVAVFDHNQVRHTRHARPVTLVIPEAE
ncbi:MAG TPA: ethylbenzene dehydrogenase-related protein [Afifellaceae bacterium]|nr:ethylbenzene dehydrogenase-related protein [Afifellaceae bacterium]